MQPKSSPIYYYLPAVLTIYFQYEYVSKKIRKSCCYEVYFMKIYWSYFHLSNLNIFYVLYYYKFDCLTTCSLGSHQFTNTAISSAQHNNR